MKFLIIRNSQREVKRFEEIVYTFLLLAEKKKSKTAETPRRDRKDFYNGMENKNDIKSTIVKTTGESSKEKRERSGEARNGSGREKEKEGRWRRGM